jgi:fibronectin-binding autotransporter adhesin
MRTSNYLGRITLFAAVALVLGRWTMLAQGASVYWIDADGYWHVSSNWSSDPNLPDEDPNLPGEDDDVIIDRPGATYTIIHSEGIDEIHSLTTYEDLIISGGTLSVATASNFFAEVGLFNGTLGGDGDIASNALFAWTGGTIAGSGTISNNGFMVLAGVDLQLKGRTLRNNLSLEFWSSSELTIGDGGTLHNASGGTISLYGTNTIDDSGSSTASLVNDGLLTKSSSSFSETTTIRVPLTNNNTINIASGILRLLRDSTNTGSYSFGSQATLELAGGTHNFEGAAHFGSGGTVLLNGGSLNFNGNPVEIPRLIMSSGTLGGTGDAGIASSGSFEWSGGMITGSGTISNYGSMGLIGVDLQLKGRTLWNYAGLSFASSSNLTIGDGGTLYNAAGGAISLYGTNTVTDSGSDTASFVNDGLLTKQFSPFPGGTTTISVPLVNNGTVDVSYGTLRLLRDSTNTGIYNIGSQATLELASGTHDFNGGGNFGNNGTVLLNGGTLNFNGNPVTIPRLIMSSGTLGGTGNAVTASGGSFEWSGGTITGSGTVSNSGYMSLAGGDLQLKGRTLLNNYGLGVWYSVLTIGDGGTLHNAAGGTFNLDGTNIIQYSGSGTASLVNDGIITKISSPFPGTTTIGIPLINNGTVDVTYGTTLRLLGDSTNTGSYSIGSQATLELSGGTHSFEGAGNFSANSGTLLLDGGTLNFNGNPVTIPRLTMSGGTLGGIGDADIASDGFSEWRGGTITGSGTISNYGTMGLAGVDLQLKGRTLKNNYSLSLWNSVLTIGDAGTLHNVGTADLNGTNTITYSGSGTASLVNDGVLSVGFFSPGTTTINVPLFNNGTVEIGNATLRFLGDSTNTGIYNIGSTLELSSGSHNFNDGGNFNVNSGTVLLDGATLNFNGNSVTIPRLIMSSGTLGGTGDAGIASSSGSFEWSGGTITGSGKISNYGSMSLIGVDLHLKGRILGNIQDLAFGSSSMLTIGDGGTLYNAATAYLYGTNTIAYSGSGSASFVNDGLLTRPSSPFPGTTTISVPLVNNGTVEITNGTLRLLGDSTNTGIYSIGSQATLELPSGTHNFNSGGNFGSDSGTVLLDGGTLNFNGNPVTIRRLVMPSGVLGGTGDASISSSGLFEWSGGTITGSGTITNNGSMSLLGVDLQFKGRTLRNNNNVVLGNSSALSIGDGGTLYNAAMGRMSLYGANIAYSGSGTASLVNDGRLTKPIPGITTISVPLINNGTIDINNGTLQLLGDSTNTGIYNILSGATLELPGGTHNFSGAGHFSSYGTVWLDGGMLNFSGVNPVTIPRLTMSSGILGGTGSLNINGLTMSGGILSGTGNANIVDFTWSGGTISGSKIVTVQIGAKNIVLEIREGAAVHLDRSALVIANFTSTLRDATILYMCNGAVLKNFYGATLDIQGTNSILPEGDGAAPLLRNDGTLRKSMSSGEVLLDVLLDNTGTVQVMAGTLSLRHGSTGTGNYSLDSETVLRLEGDYPYSAGSVYGSGELAVADSAQFTASAIAVNALTIGSTTALSLDRFGCWPLGDAAVSIPEPSTLALLGMAACGLFAFAWRRKPDSK